MPDATAVLTAVVAVLVVITTVASIGALFVTYRNKSKHDLVVQEYGVLVQAIEFERMERERVETECAEHRGRQDARIEALESGMLNRIEERVVAAATSAVHEALRGGDRRHREGTSGA